MKTNPYRWQAPGNGKIFDKPLGESSYMNTRTITVLQYIQIHKSVSQAQFEREIKSYLEQHTQYKKNDSTPSHFFRPLLFLGFITQSDSKMITLSFEGEKFLYYYQKKEYAICKKYILNQLDNSKYPNVATKDVKLQLFPFRILFKFLLEHEEGITVDFIKTKLVYLQSMDDLVLYLPKKDITKIRYFEKYDKFYTWVINSLVNIEILKKKNDKYIIAEDFREIVQKLYQNIPFESLFFHQDTLLSNLNNTTAYKRYKRNPKLIQEAKQRDNYTCQIDATHQTFLTKGHTYVEGHHVIPMFQQKNFNYSLDDVDNLISLCPTCHREIHLADNKKAILYKVYNVNKKFMQNNNLTLEELEKIYLCA